jgi:hypothetical protein
VRVGLVDLQEPQLRLVLHALVRFQLYQQQPAEGDDQ